MTSKVDIVEYTFIRQENETKPPRKRVTLAFFLTFFQIAFICCFWYYGKNVSYAKFQESAKNDLSRFYSSIIIKLHFEDFLEFKMRHVPASKPICLLREDRSLDFALKLAVLQSFIKVL